LLSLNLLEHRFAIVRRHCQTLFVVLLLHGVLFPLRAVTVCGVTSWLTEQGNEVGAEQRGLAFAQAGDLKAAEQEFRKALRVAPNSANALGELGTVLAMQGKLEESTRFLRRGLDIDPRNLDLRRYLAANLWQLHRYGEARQNLEILLKAKPNDSESLLLLGMVSENTGDYRAAVRNLAVVPDLVRKRPETIAALARSYYRVGDSEHGREWISELGSHDVGTSATLLGAEIADEAKDYEVAERLLRSLPTTALDPANLNYRLALVAFHAGKFPESRDFLTKLVASGYESGEIDYLLARCYQAERRPDEAIAVFREAVKLEPAKESYYEDLGTLLLAEKHLPAAMEVAKETVRRFPGSARALVLKGSVEQAMSQFTDAIGSFRRSNQLDGNDLDGVLGLAQAQASAGMDAEAERTLESMTPRLRDNARVELLRAQLLLGKAEGGDESAEKTAEQLLTSVVRRDAKSAEAHYLLGNLELRKDAAKEAVGHLEKAADLDPDNAKIHFALARAYRRVGRDEESTKQSELFEKLQEREHRRASGSNATVPTNN
jgi:tetratricopeptide (TPR) repeat protein